MHVKVNGLARDPARHLMITLFSTAAILALTAAPDLAMAAGEKASSTSSAAATSGQARNEQITIGGKQMQARELIGKTVMTDSNEKIGEVVDLIWRDNTYNDVIVRLDKEHSQMGVAAGKDDKRMSGNQPPTAVGGHTVAVEFDDLKPYQDGRGFVIADSALTTLKEFDYQRGASNYWTTRNNMSGGTTGTSSSGGTMGTSGSGSTMGTTSGAGGSQSESERQNRLPGNTGTAKGGSPSLGATPGSGITPDRGNTK